MVWRFVPPPGWPPPPPGFVPANGWRPDPGWPPAPAGWTFWVWDGDESSPPPPPPSAKPENQILQDTVSPAQALPAPDPRDRITSDDVQDRVASDDAVDKSGPEHPSWRVRRQEKHAAKEQVKEVASWQADQDLADEIATLARKMRQGLVTLPGLMLKGGEMPVWSTEAALIEPRVQQGHYVGKSTGVSLHVAKGVNYRVGGMRGHYVPGPEVQTPVDRGRVYVTSARVVFEGARTTREWLFGKLIGADASSDDHAVLLHVSNRAKVSGLMLGNLGPRFQAYLALGIAAGQEGGAAVAKRWSEAAETHRTQKPG
jgi:hypothetical protein